MLGSRFDHIRLQLLHGFREFPDQKISGANSVSEPEALGIHPVHFADTPVQARRKERELIRVRSNEFLIHRSGEHIVILPVDGWTCSAQTTAKLPIDPSACGTATIQRL